MKLKFPLVFITCMTLIFTSSAAKGNEKKIAKKNESNKSVTLIVWTGTVSDSWDDSDNWNPNQVPDSSSDVQILVSPNYPDATGNKTINSLELLSNTALIFGGRVTVNGNVVLNPNSTLETRGKATFNDTVTIHSNASLNARGNLDINNLVLLANSSIDLNGNDFDNFGTTEINSTATLMNVGSITSEITYKIPVNDASKWYLISPPVNGQRIGNFITNNNLALGSGISPNRNVGLAYYDNNLTYESSWVYYTDGYSGDEEFTLGQSYAMRLAAVGEATFTGNIALNDTNISISTGNDNDYNLVGNPFLSFLPANPAANSSNNIITHNTINSAALSEPTLWYWDSAMESYMASNLITDSHYIEPGQGFFVKSNTASSNFEVPIAMQTSAQEINSESGVNINPKIELEVLKGDRKKKTEIIYVSDATEGFDNGYDSSLFEGVNSNFSVYTHILENNYSKNLSIQSLPNNNYEDMIVPVGLNIEPNSEAVFKVNTGNLPSNLNVYLEDKERNIFTLLNEENASYTVALEEGNQGIGRFYIHTTTSTLTSSSSIYNSNAIKLFITQPANIQIVGLKVGTTVTLRIYDIQGKEVFKALFEAQGIDDISLPQIKKGVYIVRLVTHDGILNKKIVLD